MKSMIAAAALLAASSMAAQAATLTLDFDSLSNGPDTNVDLGGGFKADYVRIVDGNCASGNCLALNQSEVTVISRTDGAAFSVSSYWYQLLGRPADLRVTAFDVNGAEVSNDFWQGSVDGFNTGVTVSASFVDIYSLSFDNEGTGNIRVDDLGLSYDDPAPVPVPAAGLMLLTALGAGFAMRRRVS